MSNTSSTSITCKTDQMSDSGESFQNTSSHMIDLKKTAFDWDLYDDRAKVLNEMRNKQQFVDLLVTTEDGGQEAVHLAVVSALSKEFTDYLIEQMKSSEEVTLSNGMSVKKVEVENTVKSSLKSIVDFSYTGSLETTISDVWILIETAERYSLEDVLDSSLTYLIRHLSVDNCIRLLLLGLKHRHKLANASYAFIRIKFIEVIDKCIDFVTLGYSQLETLVTDDELNVRTERTVFEAIIRWIGGDIEHRKDKLHSLLSLLRFGRIELSFIENEMTNNCLIKDNIRCKELVKQFRKEYKLLSKKKDGNGMYVGLSPSAVRPRVPDQILMTFGGWKEGIPSTLMEIYDIRTNLWFDTKLSHERPRAYHGIQVVDGLVYVIGGTDGINILNTVECFNSIDKKWFERTPMSSTRCYVSTTALNGIIYAMGGHNGRNRLKSCEKYEPTKNEWTAIEEMNMARSDASAAVHHNKIYICGGLNDVMIENTCEVYDIVNKSWTFIASMSVPRTSLGLVTFKSSLYALGGNNGVERLETVERYDFKLRSWLPMAPMKSKRSTFATGVIEDRLLAVGGYNGQTPISLVEAFDPEENQWTEVRCLTHDRSGLSVCVLTGLSNSVDYTYIGVNEKKIKKRDKDIKETIEKTIDIDMDQDMQLD